MKTNKLTITLLLTVVASLASCVPITPYPPGGSDHIPPVADNNLYQRVVINGRVYYKRNGLYYKRINRRYIRTNPYGNASGYQRVVINGQTYYKKYGRYYKRINGRYIQTDPYSHASYRKVVVRGQVYYIRNGRYYKRVGNNYVLTRNPYGQITRPPLVRPRLSL